MINGSPYVKFKDPFAKLSQPEGNITLNNLYDNLKIKLKKDKEPFSVRHPYLRDTVHGAVSGATMLLNYQDQNRMKKAQRDYVNDPFNLYDTSAMKKYGSYPWLTSTGQFTDFPNEKVPVYEPGYQNSAYTNPMATAKKGGQLYMAFQGGGATNQFGSGSNLPKYEMGVGSPIQNAIQMDSSHYGIPVAQKGGGFFTPERLTNSTENIELYNKPNNFLNYLKDMSVNAITQKALGRRRPGQLSDAEAMGMAQMGMPMPQQAQQQAPQQGGQQEQLIQMVAQALQQGASPEEIMQKLVEMGVPQDQAMQVIQMVAEQLQGSQEQMPEEMEQQMPMAQMGMGMSGSDFEEFGFNGQNPLNPYYAGIYDPNEAKQANASLVEGLYGSAQQMFSKPIAKKQQRDAEFYEKMQKLQDMITSAETPTARYGGRYQDQGAVQQPSFYDDAMEQYNWFMQNPDSWAGDPDMTNEDGSLNLCIDCLNVDYSNPDHVMGINRLIEEGFSKGPHMEENHTLYTSALNNLGLAAPVYKSKQAKMKRGGMTRYQSKGITKPTATDTAGFEKWYNETMGNLISSGATQAEIDSFMDMAGNWASDIKVDRNQLQQKAEYPLTYTTEYTVPGESGINTYIGNRKTRANQDKYQQEYLDILKKFDTDYDLAVSKNQIASKRNDYKANPQYLIDLEKARDNAIQALENKYPTAAATDQDFFYNKAGTPPGTPPTNPGTTTTTGPGGYQFNPAMQQLLSAMAAGYTKAPLFGFRTKRNINALFNQTMADMMLKGQGQGQGTAGATGSTIPGAPAMGPNGASNTWFKDNNINQYDIKQGPNRFKMKIRANQPGQGIVQYDANGNLITTGGPGQPGTQPGKFDPFRTRNFDPYPRGTTGTPDPKYTRLTSQINPSIGYEPKVFLEKLRNRYAENRLDRIGSKVDRAYQKERYLEDLADTGLGSGILDKRENKARDRREKRYNSLAKDFSRGEYMPPEKMPQQRYGGAYAMGGQYQQGGTYYLSDEEIQALLAAGYELE